MGNNIAKCNDEELQHYLYSDDKYVDTYDYTEVDKYMKIRHDDQVLDNIYGFNNGFNNEKSLKRQFNYMD